MMILQLIWVTSAQHKNLEEQNNALISLLLILVLCFAATRRITFYILFELSLIPIALLVFGWGYQPERFSAALSIILYTMLASLPLLIGIIHLGSEGTSDLLNCSDLFPPKTQKQWAYVSLSAAFLVKLPIYLVHLWLPKAHVEAPVTGSIILAAILLKLGGLGLWRFSVFINCSFVLEVTQGVRFLGGSLIALLCLVQTDIKVLVAYSSIAHISLTIAAALSLTITGMTSSWTVLLAHGFSSSAIFAGAFFLRELTGSRNLILHGGSLAYVPLLRAIWFMICAVNGGIPPTVNFVSELFRVTYFASATWILLWCFAVVAFAGVGYRLLLYCFCNQRRINSGVRRMPDNVLIYGVTLAPHLFLRVRRIYLLI